jgi:hypothetical protein
VACVLEALLHQPTIRRRLARAGGRDDLDDVHTAQLCFLAFIHDLGKCALGFRAKAVPELGRIAGHLAALKPLICGPLSRDLGKLLDAQQLEAWAGDALEAFLLAVFAHHGRTPDLEYRQGPDIDLLQGWTGRGESRCGGSRSWSMRAEACLPKPSRTALGRCRARRLFSICSPAS